MKRILHIIFLLIIVTSCIFIGSCKKDTVNFGPTLSFVIDTGYIYSDTAMAVGDTALIGIKYTWNGKNQVRMINVLYNGQKYGDPIDINQIYGKEFTWKTKIMKYIYSYETWEFEVVDTKNHVSTIGLSLAIDSGGPIKNHSTMVGVQSHPFFGSFFSFEKNLFYNSDNALIHQDSIDMIAGYDFDIKSFMGSPGSSDLKGIYNLSSWTKKNLTQYCTSTYTSTQFDLIEADNLLKSSFHENKALDLIAGLKPNQIYSFRTQNGKFGIMRITSVAQNETGQILFDYKIQK